jgi:succinyl-CoA--D-citramalate CoA-transferase
LAEAMEQPALADDARFSSHAARGQHQSELDDLIAAWTIKYTADDLQARMDEAGVPAGRIYTAKEMLADPHFAARQSIVEVQDEQLGGIKMQNVVPKLSETPGGIDWTGPALGQHNAEIYEGLLGLTPEQIREFQERKII